MNVILSTAGNSSIFCFCESLYRSKFSH